MQNVQPATEATAETLEDYRWVTGPQAEAWLARAAAFSGELTAGAARLRSHLSPQRASLVLKQVELRWRARDKFSAAARMFFTAVGLEQATDEIVARYKAARLGAGRRLIDLCCGIGGDLVALAGRGETVGVDRDPRSAIIAAANARVQLAETRQPTIHTGDVAEVDLAACDGWHIDPDRRKRARRTTRVEFHEPNDAVIDRLLARNSHAAVKLAPAAVWPEHWNDRAELEWIARGRSCRQLVAWFGAAAKNPGQRRATLLGSDGEPLGTLVGQADQDVPVARRIERYLFEPDSSVLAARLDAALAFRHGLAAVAPGIAYWTASGPVVEGLLAGFEVEEVLSFDLKRLKALLTARKIGRLEIKVRGVDQDPHALRRRLRPAGDREATLLVTRIERRVTAILAHRLETNT